jgi:hypothetical protein
MGTEKQHISRKNKQKIKAFLQLLWLIRVANDLQVYPSPAGPPCGRNIKKLDL